MKTQWRFIDTGPQDAFYNMAFDEAIAINVIKGLSPPTLRLYGWSLPSVSIGCFQGIKDIDREYCSINSIPVVRRPTGGRAILHNEEITYSFSSKSMAPFFSTGLLDTYAVLSEALYWAISSAGIDIRIKKRREHGRTLAGSALCFQSVSYGELSVDDKKVIGSAQKRWRGGFLQQGSIQMRIDPEAMEKVFIKSRRDDILKTMTGLKDVMPELDAGFLKSAIIDAFEEAFQVRIVPECLTDGEMTLAHELQEKKYSSESWTCCR